MSSPDSLGVAAHALLSMTEQEYLFLLIKLLGMAAGLFGAAVGFLVALYKFAKLLWSKGLESLREDLSASFCTPAQLESAIKEAMSIVSDRLDDGDARMGRTDDEIRRTREAVEQLSRRFTRILALLVAQEGGAPRHNPMLKEALESDSELPLFDLPAGESACAG